MKILILTPDIYTRGGIARYTASLASALGDLIGPENVHVQPLLDMGDACESSAKYRVLNPVADRLTTATKLRFAGRALRLARHKYSLVICTHLGLSPVAGLIRVLFGTPFWVTCHGREAWPPFPADVRWAVRQAELVVPISRFTAETVSKVNGVRQSKMQVLYNAIPDDFARLLMSTNSSSADLEGKAKTILSVGMVSTMHPYKGFDTVIRALPKVLQAVPNARYVVVGEGDDIGRLKTLAREADVQGRVEIRGGVSDAELASCYRACDVFVLPSSVRMNQRWEGEGFGRVYVEAALAGKPVVGSRDGGAAEAVLHDKTGLLVDPTSVDEVADALIVLLQDPKLAARMGEEGRQWAASNFTVAALTKKLVSFIEPYSASVQALEDPRRTGNVRFTGRGRPLVSVCIPTYKRLSLLKRAIASVYAQTYGNWELVVSDDEDPVGETWGYLQGLEKSDPRIRVFRNEGQHGQVANTNNTFLHARGEWIKPLHDDDVLRPECLERLLTAGSEPSVAIVSGLSCEMRQGRRIHSLRRRGAAPMERIPQRYVHLGMFLQDCSLGIPSQIIVRKAAVEGGAVFRDVPGVRFAVDTWWNCLLAEHGDVMLVDDVVIEHCQDKNLTLTSEISSGDLEAEYPIVLKRIRESIDPSLSPPPLPLVLQMVMGIRALHYLSKKHFREAFKLALKVHSPGAIWLIARWVFRQRFPSMLSTVPRIKSEVPIAQRPTEVLNFRTPTT